MSNLKPAGAGTPDNRQPAPAAHPSGHTLQIVVDTAALRWQDDALCAEIGVGLFFPRSGGDPFTAAARAVCASCPVKDPCLEYALEMEARPDVTGRYGIWGGTTPRERRALARSRERNAA